MLDIGWPELFVIGVIALVVIGPKDLPQVMRTVAGFVRKARGLSQEFHSGVAQIMREAELDDLKRKLDAAGRVDIGKTITDTVDPTGSVTADFDPADFARDLKRSVENPPTTRAPTAGAEPGATAPDPSASDQGPSDPSPHADDPQNAGRAPPSG